MFVFFDWLDSWPFIGRILRFVNENRGLFATLSVTLIGIGLGGYVSLRIANAVSKHHYPSGSLKDLCFAVFAGGVLVFPILQYLYLRMLLFKTHVTFITTQGEILFDRLNGLDKDSDDSLEKFKKDYNEWTYKSKKWLVKHDKHAAVHFENRAGLLEVHGLIGGSETANYLINLDNRLKRLGEIMTGKL